jgi:hypothetical protein
MKESRMEFINPIKVCRKSGGAPPSLFATRKKRFGLHKNTHQKALYQGTTLVVAKTATIDGL